MTTNLHTDTADEAFLALENAGNWRTAAALGFDEAVLHWLADKLWVDRKCLGTDKDTGLALFTFRAR